MQNQHPRTLAELSGDCAAIESQLRHGGSTALANRLMQPNISLPRSGCNAAIDNGRSARGQSRDLSRPATYWLKRQFREGLETIDTQQARNGDAHRSFAIRRIAIPSSTSQEEPPTGRIGDLVYPMRSVVIGTNGIIAMVAAPFNTSFCHRRIFPGREIWYPVMVMIRQQLYD